MPGAVTLSRTTLAIMALGLTTLSLTTHIKSIMLNIMDLNATFSKKRHSVITLLGITSLVFECHMLIVVALSVVVLIVVVPFFKFNFILGSYS